MVKMMCIKMRKALGLKVMPKLRMRLNSNDFCQISVNTTTPLTGYGKLEKEVFGKELEEYFAK